MIKHAAEHIESWTLTPAATLGSSVRAKGILLELRARLPFPLRKQLDLRGMELTFSTPQDEEHDARAACVIIEQALTTIEDLAVLPREIEDILTITTTERRRWLDDGRLPSSGIRTVRLRGRAKRISFHVFEPKLVEDILNSGIVDDWREHDLAAKAENRRRAAHQAKLTRSLKKQKSGQRPDRTASGLTGWDAFDKDGLLR